MSYQPVSGIVPQYSDDSNQLASGFYVKFYIANTTTPLSMATDSTGGTLLTKAKLNPDGLPISNPADNTTVFIPHVDQDYRLVIYRNEADANANNTAGAFLNVPKVEPLTQIGADLSDFPVDTSTGTQTLAVALDDRVVRVGSVAGLAGVTPVDGGQYNVKEFWPDTNLGGDVFEWDAGISKTLHNGGTIIDPSKLSQLGAIGVYGTYFTPVGSGTGCFVRINSSGLSKDTNYFVEWFGAIPSSSTDNTDPIKQAHSVAKAKTPATLIFGKGTFNYTDLGNLAAQGMTIKGICERETFLKCTSTSVTNAITVDAFASGSPSDPYIESFNMRDFTIEGNGSISRGVYCRGIARSYWENIYVRELEPTAGIAYRFEGVQLNRFVNVGSSTNHDPQMVNIPYEGINIAAGTRAGVSVGNSSNNIFMHCYPEGLGIGVRLFAGDNNVFLGGSPEKCSVYGLLVGSGSRYNTFIGAAFENLNSTADVADSGIYTRYINCYSSESFLIQGSSRGVSVEGCYFERLEIQSGARQAKIDGVTVNNWNTGVGGFFDNGVDTVYRRIYDIDLGTYLHPKKTRLGITVGASPFTWVNDTDLHAEVVIQGGTVSLIQQNTNGDTWGVGDQTNIKIMLRPGDSIITTYSAAPSMSYITQNELG